MSQNLLYQMHEVFNPVAELFVLKAVCVGGRRRYKK